MANASYIASFIATILGLIEPFGKKMKTILPLNFTGNFLVGLSYLMVGQNSGAAICAFACVQVFINYIFDSKGKKVPFWLIIVYAVIFLSINLMTFAHWYDVFALAASMVFVVSVAQSNAKHYRILAFVNSSIWIFYDFLAAAYGNLFTHVVLLIFQIISVIVRDVKGKKDDKGENQHKGKNN